MTVRNLMFTAAMAVSAVAPATAATYKITQLIGPNAAYTYANGINDHGLVVGTILLNGGGGTWHGFTYDVKTKVYTVYDTIPGCPYQCSGVWMSGVNNKGVISGYTADSGYEDFTDHKGKFTLYIPQGEAQYDVLSLGLNDAGTKVGYYTDNNSFVAGYTYTKDKVFTSYQYNGYNSSIQAINNTGLVVGYYQYQAQNGFTYDGTTSTSLTFPGAYNTTALGVNDAGVVVGNYGASSGARHAFMYSKGVYTAIPDVVAGQYNSAWKINNKGDILVQVGTAESGGIVSYILTPNKN